MDENAHPGADRDTYGDGAENELASLDARGQGAEDGILTLVCLKCGTEYYFGRDVPPDSLQCEKCHNTVFRSFYTPEADDEAAADFSESTSRDMNSDDAEGETLPGDVLDLDRG
jgi:hypothetical protein